MAKPKAQLHVTEIIHESSGKTLKSAYTGTIGKNAKIELTRDQVELIGTVILEQIREEIAEDTKKAGGFRGAGQPVALPNTKKFADSFSFKIIGDRTLEFTSDWPTARAHTLGQSKDLEMGSKNKGSTGEFQMKWLISPQVPYARIVQSNGKIVVVATPNPADGDAMWVHPGFRKYSFLERGIRKGKQKALEIIAAQMTAQLLADNGFL